MSETKVVSVREAGQEKTCGHRHRSPKAAYRCMSGHGLPRGKPLFWEIIDADSGEVLHTWQTLWVETDGGGWAQTFHIEDVPELLSNSGGLRRYHATLDRLPWEAPAA